MFPCLWLSCYSMSLLLLYVQNHVTWPYSLDGHCQNSIYL
jgi:hypothetical protein